MPVRREKLVVPDASTIKGCDTAGNEYDNVDELWKKNILNEDGTINEDKKKEWYKKGVDYWNKVDASVDGVLGGFGHVTKADVKGTREFFALLNRINFNGAAVECGGGIGRTSAALLTPLFKEVDIVEPTPHFIQKARELLKDNPRMKNFYEVGLEEWEPTPNRYSLIWCQWVLPHLTDDDLVDFFKKCVPALAPGGIIGVKENVASEFIMDTEDTSITRTDAQYKAAFHRAGLKLLASKTQTGFPKQLLPVKMYALIPDPAVYGDLTKTEKTE